jgi:hypothetical protein
MPNKLFNLVHGKLLFILILILGLVFSFAGVYSADLTDNSTNLLIGKNHIKFNLAEPFYARDLVKLNPSIAVVSYTEDNGTIGYVNLFGGIGENFIIENELDYEIILKKNTELVLPSGAIYLNGVA